MEAAAEPTLANSSVSQIDSPPHVHKWIITVAVMTGTIMEVLDLTIVNVALPHMQGSLSASVDQIAWVSTSYLVANGIMIPMTAWISSRFGRKRYFLASVATFSVASALCDLANSLDQIILFRIVQGAAGATMVPSSQAIMMETFPPEEQQLAMAMWGMGMMVAPIAGPTLGGWITDNLSWRWNFYINLPVGLLALIMVSTFVHDPVFLRRRRAKGGRIDYLGITFLVLGLGLGQMVLDRGQLFTGEDPAVRITLFSGVEAKTLPVAGRTGSALNDALAEEPSEYLAAIIFHSRSSWALVKSELPDVRWGDVDFARRTLQLPKTEVGRPHLLPLRHQSSTLNRPPY